MEDLGNFESLEQKERVLKILEILVGPMVSPDLNSLSKVDIETLLQLGKELDKSGPVEIVDLGLKESKVEKVKSKVPAQKNLDSEIYPSDLKHLLDFETGKVWLLHSNGFSLVDSKSVESVIERQVFKNAQLPPESQIMPHQKQQYQQEVARLKKLPYQILNRGFIGTYEESMAEDTVLTDLGKFSWSQDPGSHVQESKDFSDTPRSPIKAWERFNFSNNKVHAINMYTLDYLREELKKEDIEQS